MSSSGAKWSPSGVPAASHSDTDGAVLRRCDGSDVAARRPAPSSERSVNPTGEQVMSTTVAALTTRRMRAARQERESLRMTASASK
jgi:hypothetical protein